MTVLSSLFRPAREASQRSATRWHAWTRSAPSPDRSSDAELDPVIRNIKAQIAQGTYETPERLDTAVDRLLESLS